MVENSFFQKVVNNSDRLTTVESRLFDGIVTGNISVRDDQTVISFYAYSQNLTGTATVAASLGYGFIDLVSRSVLIYRSDNDGFFVVAILA